MAMLQQDKTGIYSPRFDCKIVLVTIGVKCTKAHQRSKKGRNK